MIVIFFQAIELLTNCYVLVQGSTVCAIGSMRGLKEARPRSDMLSLALTCSCEFYVCRILSGEADRGRLYEQRAPGVQRQGRILINIHPIHYH